MKKSKNALSVVLKIIVFFICILSVSCKPQGELTLNLAGSWQVALDSLSEGEDKEWFINFPTETQIDLPGTLDLAGVGTPNNLEPGLNNKVLSHLARKHEYIGPAWYRKTIDLPEGWESEKMILHLERVMWESKVWINGELVGKAESLVASHEYIIDSGKILKPGKNTIVIRIDNSNLYPSINVIGEKYPVTTSKEMAHGYTNHTQIKWNGILGELSLKPYSLLHEVKVRTIDADRKLLLSFPEKIEEKSISYEISLNHKSVEKGKIKLNNLGEVEIKLSEEILPWDEFNPNLYDLVLSDGDLIIKKKFGLRKLDNSNGILTLNDQRIFLRGTLECGVFPETGHPAMDKDAWQTIINSAKSYGLNHFRFHSWCPPKAAFEAADELGFYFQIELPHWNLQVGKDQTTNEFLLNEADLILKSYGNHPSFIMMALGNELEGDIDWMNATAARLKEKDNSRLFTTTSFSFQKGVGQLPLQEDEFFITQWTDKGWIRGQTIFESDAPAFDKNYSQMVDHIKVPIISHEIGQYSVYPDLSEIDKYQGVLKPLNFIAVKEDLERKGLIELAPEFILASGKLAALLYKEEIERALKTPGFDGFQLLQLQDFPGQGTALVGLLNVFWESKGVISAEEFKMFSNEIVPLLNFEKAVYKSGETLTCQVQIANFYQPLKEQTLIWEILSKDEVLATDSITKINIPIGNQFDFGKFSTKLESEKASEFRVRLSLKGTDYKNEWKIWVYPDQQLAYGDVIFTRSYPEAKKALEEGRKVLYNPDFNQINGVKGKFLPVFWSPVHFPEQPSTMGILNDPGHPALNYFPTDIHSDWQWWDLCVNSKAVDISAYSFDPIVRVIDNFVTNRSLSNTFEVSVGKGKLLMTTIDLSTDMENRIVAKQFKFSLINYMNTSGFEPNESISMEDFKEISSQKK
ncbi:glycoside hydrolase family 2 [Belliella sp. R4-6]|uniref:Glycoside hydrolase family 2 n=1 Tax=Belliella alkalica TaxID=1730871 RepID=A0ABS9VD97_9BACT|nr:sugar-binding domain-containing protein [Belliella alkalica]MCH7414358.1 glycoside hydrolase family 2 [Belliella alkalica]